VAYTTTKAGLQGFTLSVAAEGIRANCLLVGTVNTPMVAKLGMEALTLPGQKRKMLSKLRALQVEVVHEQNSLSR
jgi:NAD(P)-dependent dehydrogenase (short-subunit alcohol dehydrogenase family)